MDATDPLARLAAALETLSTSQLRLAQAAERLAGVAEDEVPRQRLLGAADRSRRTAREANAAAARAAGDVPPLEP